MSDEPLIPKGPGFLPTFLYYSSGTALVVAFLASKSLGLGLETGLPSLYGLVFGVFGGLVGSYFNRSQVLEVPFSNRKTFTAQLEAALGEMGYVPVPAADLGADWPGVAVYQRSALRRMFSGRVYVQMGDRQAILSSRAIHLRGLKKRLC